MDQDEHQNIEETPKNKVEHSTQDTNRIMGMAAIFISLLSMAAVIYQSYLAREENELTRIQQSASVLPYLSYYYNNIGPQYKFVLINKGVGPAFIKEVKFMGVNLKKDSVSIFSRTNEFHDFISEQSTFLDSIPATRSPIYENMLLSPNEKREIMVFSFDNINQKERFSREYYKYYKGHEIIYEDVYGAAWMLSSNKNHPIKLKADWKTQPTNRIEKEDE